MKRTWSVFVKSMREQLRQPLVLSLTLVFAPVFVFLYYILFPSGSTTMGVDILNLDQGRHPQAAAQLVETLKELKYASGNPMLVVRLEPERARAESRLRNRETDIVLVIPKNFSSSLLSMGKENAVVTFIGDLTNPRYGIAAAITSGVLQDFVLSASGQPSPVQVTEETIGASAARSEFETYVPGLLVFAVIMLVFQAAMAVTREVESGALLRLRLSCLSPLEYLGGISLGLTLIGIISILLTFLTALACGFHSQGPLWIAILAGGLTAFSVIGTGLMVAGLSKTVNQAFLIANFPLGFFMFFSGSVFPMPRVTLLTLFGRPLGPFELLPPTHAVNALNKVFTLGAGFQEVWFELAALAILSALYFAAGVWLFARTHLKH